MRVRAFTIIELLITITIISLLMAAAALSIGTARQNTRDGTRIGDILLISHAIDQSASLRRGIYPTNALGGNPGKMCVNELATPATNPNSLDLTLFAKGVLPSDPLARSPKTQGCASYLDGYTYHSSVGPSLAKQDGVSCYNYVLEVGLENEKGPDEASLVTGQSLNQPVVTDPRYQYFLLGHYLGTSCP